MCSAQAHGDYALAEKTLEKVFSPLRGPGAPKCKPSRSLDARYESDRRRRRWSLWPRSPGPSRWRRLAAASQASSTAGRRPSLRTPWRQPARPPPRAQPELGTRKRSARGGARQLPSIRRAPSRRARAPGIGREGGGSRGRKRGEGRREEDASAAGAVGEKWERARRDGGPKDRGARGSGGVELPCCGCGRGIPPLHPPQ